MCVGVTDTGSESVAVSVSCVWSVLVVSISVCQCVFILVCQYVFMCVSVCISVCQ